MTTVAEPSVSQAVIDKLFAVLKSWADDMDAFRYEMFAKRLVAAERGRPDAVEWARSWHQDLEEEERQLAAEKLSQAQQMAEQRAFLKAEFQAGRCANPHYQAFLDTVEHPELINNHVEYFAWIRKISSKCERLPGFRNLSEAEKLAAWRQILLQERDANLAPRMNGQPTPLNFG